MTVVVAGAVVDAGALAEPDAGVLVALFELQDAGQRVQPRKRPVLPAPADMPRVLKPKMALLIEQCARVACTAGLVERNRKFVALSPEEVADLQNDVDACFAACRR